MQPHGFFNSSPAIDVPPSPGDLDDKENAMAVKPSQNGLIAKLWKYQKQRYSSSISLFMCLCLSISLLCKFECIMWLEFSANMHFCYPPVLIKQYTNIWKSTIDKMINEHHTYYRTTTSEFEPRSWRFHVVEIVNATRCGELQINDIPTMHLHH